MSGTVVQLIDYIIYITCGAIVTLFAVFIMSFETTQIQNDIKKLTRQQNMLNKAIANKIDDEHFQNFAWELHKYQIKTTECLNEISELNRKQKLLHEAIHKLKNIIDIDHEQQQESFKNISKVLYNIKLILGMP